jgi:uncharacterized membrane protein
VKFKWLIIGVVVCLYIGFRLVNLSTSCLWFDEIFSVHAAQHSWNTLFGFVAQDLIHPPLFYVLLKIWMTVGGESLLWLRLFPASMACLALVPLVLLCRELKFSTFETATAILFLAVNGSLIKYSQEVRMYSLLVCLMCFSLWLFVRWGKNEKSSLVPLFVCNLLLIYTHYFGALIVLTEFVIALWLRREYYRKWLILSGVWILSFAPWVYVVFAAYRQNGGLGQNLNWAGKPGLLQVLQLLASLHQPFYFQQSSRDSWISIFALPAVLICIAALIFLFANNEEENPPGKKTLPLFCLVPLVIAFIVSWVTPFSIWGARHLTVIFVPYFLLVAMGLCRIKPGLVRSLCCAVVIGSFIPAAILNYDHPVTVYPWCAWGPLTAQIKESPAADIYVFEDVIAYELWFAIKRDAPGKFHVVLIEDDPDIKEDKAYFLPRGFDEVPRANESSITGDKFWVAVRGIGEDTGYPLWKRLQEKGYKIGTPLRFDAEGVNVYFVPVELEAK